jgi:hypothetical protein
MRFHTAFAQIAALIGCLMIAAGCGGGGAPEAGSESAKTPAKAAAKEPSDSDEAAGGSEEKSEKTADKGKDKADKDKTDPETGMPKPQRTPEDIITAPDVSFVLAFANSEPGEKAEKECAAKSKDNPKKQNQCMAKARHEIREDIMHFTKDKDEKRWWTVSHMQGQRLKLLHKVQIEFTDEKDDSIAIKLVGKDRGARPWKNPPSKVTIKVPNEFSIEIKDPTYGKLVYEAKIGIVGKD